jgi:hypothetical protein
MLHKKMLLSLAAVLAIGAGGTMATFGGFVGSTSSAHDFSAGKIVPQMSVTDTNGNSFDISNIVPGDTANGTINIHNAGPTAFKYETLTITRSDENSPLDHAIWMNSDDLSSGNYSTMSNWGLTSVENHPWTINQRIGSGQNGTVHFSFKMVPTDRFGNKLDEIDNSDPLQGAKQTLTFTVKAFQRDGAVRTYHDSVDL